jgi:8-oxo-dGTP pyrophosphatase MutT (NUDIX family)
MSMREFVCGFLMSGGEVALVSKTRPAWQLGKLNGVGGEVLTNEDPLVTMCREWCEETGDKTAYPWQEFMMLQEPDGTIVHFFRAETEVPEPGGPLLALPPTNDVGESLGWYDLDHLRSASRGYTDRLIPNLHWLLPMAFMDAYHVDGQVRGASHD